MKWLLHQSPIINPTGWHLISDSLWMNYEFLVFSCWRKTRRRWIDSLFLCCFVCKLLTWEGALLSFRDVAHIIMLLLLMLSCLAKLGTLGSLFLYDQIKQQHIVCSIGFSNVFHFFSLLNNMLFIMHLLSNYFHSCAQENNSDYERPPGGMYQKRFKGCALNSMLSLWASMLFYRFSFK